MPVRVINFRGYSFKLVQDKSMKLVALQSTIMHDNYQMYLHTCNNINSIYCIFQEVIITVKICRTYLVYIWGEIYPLIFSKCFKPTLDLFWFLKYFDSTFWFSCIPLIAVVYKANANFWDLDDAKLITVLKRCLKSLFSCRCSSMTQFWWHTATLGSSSAMLWPWSCGSVSYRVALLSHYLEGAMRQQDWRVCFPFLLPSATKELHSADETYLNLKSSQMSTFTVQQRHLPARWRHWFQV